MGMHGFLWSFCVLLLCGMSQGSVEIAVEFGQNMTLNCPIATKEFYWFIQQKYESPVYILRSLSSNMPPFYNNQRQEFRNKYSLQNLGRLFIHNVTRNELGSYYCVKIRDPPIFGNVTRVTEKANATVPSVPCDCVVVNEEDCLKSWIIPLFAVSCFLCVFIIILLVAIIRHYTRKRNTSVEEPHHPDSFVSSDITLSDPPTETLIRDSTSTYVVFRCRTEA